MTEQWTCKSSKAVFFQSMAEKGKQQWIENMNVMESIHVHAY